jgi:hypothetical protein
VFQEVTIVWVNNITTSGLNWLEDGCYSPTSVDHDCEVDTKILPKTPDQESCTFNDPTSLGFSKRIIRVNKDRVPISPHIHGL